MAKPVVGIASLRTCSFTLWLGLCAEDPAYSDWYIKFKPQGPWSSKKCDTAQPTLCSDLYHSQEQSPGYPHGDGDCVAPGCDCGKVPCGFYGTMVLDSLTSYSRRSRGGWLRTIEQQQQTSQHGAAATDPTPRSSLRCFSINVCCSVEP